MTIGERLQQIVQEWFATEPLLFAVICTHSLECNSKMNCDMRCGKGIIEYNPQRLEHLDDQRLALRLKAEVVRIMLKHPYQRQPYNPRRDVMKLSSDITIVDSMPEMEQIGLVGGNIFNLPHNKAYEQYYALMVGNNMLADNPDGAPMPGEGGEIGDMGEPTNASSDMRSQAETAAGLWQEDELLADKINKEIEQAQKTQQWGSIAGELRNLIESTLVSTQNFRAILSRFRSTIISTKRHLTRMRPNRRYGFDAMGSQYAYSTRLLVAVDVSGSVSDDELRKFLAVINRFFKQGIEHIEVIEFDSVLQTQQPIALKAATHSLQITGRGGTNFQPAIDYYYDHPQYDGLIMLTDGYAAPPTLPADKAHRPLIWLLTQDGAKGDELLASGPICRITGL